MSERGHDAQSVMSRRGRQSPSAATPEQHWREGSPKGQGTQRAPFFASFLWALKERKSYTGRTSLVQYGGAASPGGSHDKPLALGRQRSLVGRARAKLEMHVHPLPFIPP